MHMRILTLTETLEIFAVHVKIIFIVHFKMIFTNSSITYVELFDVGSAGLRGLHNFHTDDLNR